MSTFRNLVLVALAAIFALGLVVTAVAGPVGGETNGTISQLRQDYRDNLRALVGPPANPNTIPNGQGVKLAPAGLPGQGFSSSPAAPCAVQTQQCPGLEEVFIFSVPSAAGTGTRRALSTQIRNTGLLPESVKTVYVAVIWDPLGEVAAPATAGTPTLRVHVQGDLGGLPDDGNILATDIQPFAVWQPTLPLIGVAAQYGVVAFDVSGAGVVMAPGSILHATCWVDQPAPGVDWTWLLADDGTTSTCPERSSNFRSNIPGWIGTVANYGSPFNFSFYIETCTEQPPPVCFTDMPHCDPSVYAGTVTIFTMPRTIRDAFANRFYAGQAGQDQPCTVKTLYPWFYENDADDSADIVIEIREDDGGGLPGPILWEDTLYYGSFVMDLSNYTAVSVPDLVVTGEWYVAYRAINARGVLPANGHAITFVGSELGNAAAHAECGGVWQTNAMFVDLPGVQPWVDDVTFFGGESELWVSADVCCPPLSFAVCTPASDPDWETQGNGIGRPNATDASLSSLCGLTQSWTASPGGACNMVQPLIAGSSVLIAGVDSLHSYDKATGA